MITIKKQRIVTDILGTPSRQNQEYLYPSVCCGHHKKKLSINFEKNVAKCWVCDWRTKNIKRVVRRWGTRKHLDAWRDLEGDAHTGDLDNLFEIATEQEQRIDLPAEFKTLTGVPSVLDNRALSYLRSRRITKEDILRWKIGYCAVGQYENRIIIPSFGVEGYCNFFTARSWTKDNWPPYLNGPGNKDIIFNDLYVDWTTDVSLVEGVFDAIVAGPNSIPLLGSTLREESKLFQKLAYNDTPVYVALDPDAEKKALRLIKALLQYDLEVYKVPIAPYNDVGEMTKQEYQSRKKAAEPFDSDTFLLHAALAI